MLKHMLENVRQMNPLVHNITNYVTVNDCANILLACGGSPIMADDSSEVEEIIAICNALVINIGTLNERTIQAMLAAGKMANQKGRPIVFDPVGIGASVLRTDTAKRLLTELEFSVIRGNISEIKMIYRVMQDRLERSDSPLRVQASKGGEDKATEGKATEDNATEGKATEGKATEDKATEGKAKEDKATEDKATEGKATEDKAKEDKATEGKVEERITQGRGVDASVTDYVSEATLNSTVTFAMELARMTKAVIVITGTIDIIADAEIAYIVRNGHPMMGRITGSGCMLTAVLGAYSAANTKDLTKACTAAVSAMGICGELAYEKVAKMGEGTGTFRTYLIDYMSLIDGAMLEQRAKLQQYLIE